MFMGEYFHTIDEKSRLIIPAKFRDMLGTHFIVTKGLDHCLFVYPMSEWQVLEEKLRALPFTQPEARAFVRFFFSGANECELDKQGRILVSASLREYAQLEKEVVLVGVASRVEIWNRNLWADYTEQAGAEYAGSGSALVNLGI
ncbi:MAG: division/cell wall cluster transcriptional repressor MraZ [Peptococcaceae bacterium]|jgi:MraZ protein|nr:division/cell wall cluster transcriptional repressor MraZ [Peptococcaceae bacterium]